MTRSIPQPDLSPRPFDSHAERWMPYPAQRLYRAWSEEFGLWFADPATVRMEAAEGQPFFFQTEYRAENQKAERHSHYGRFLRLVPGKLVEITWVTGKGGTEGAETVLTVEFIPENDGTRVKLAHRGFPHEQARAQHEAAWPVVLEQQENKLGGDAAHAGKRNVG
jgi:uncharacterized protein YndB with AHSA1/START domain